MTGFAFLDSFYIMEFVNASDAVPLFQMMVANLLSSSRQDAYEALRTCMDPSLLKKYESFCTYCKHLTLPEFSLFLRVISPRLNLLGTHVPQEFGALLNDPFPDHRVVLPHMVASAYLAMYMLHHTTCEYYLQLQGYAWDALAHMQNYARTNAYASTEARALLLEPSAYDKDMVDIGNNAEIEKLTGIECLDTFYSRESLPLADTSILYRMLVNNLTSSGPEHAKEGIKGFFSDKRTRKKFKSYCKYHSAISNEEFELLLTRIIGNPTVLFDMIPHDFKQMARENGVHKAGADTKTIDYLTLLYLSLYIIVDWVSYWHLMKAGDRAIKHAKEYKRKHPLINDSVKAVMLDVANYTSN